MSNLNRYAQIIEAIFQQAYQKGMERVEFSRSDFEGIARSLGIAIPKNLGDIIYSFKYRTQMPPSILATAPPDKTWIIRNVGRAKYAFDLVKEIAIKPNEALMAVKVPDSTPAIVTMYAFNDEQALLTRIRYNRLLDIFTRVTCYSLQNHLRTSVEGIGQIETDELYIGIDKNGVHYALPIQAKSKIDRLGVTQIEQDIALCQAKFPHLICRPVGAQFMANGLIALFEFVDTDDGIRIKSE